MLEQDNELLYFADPMCSWCWGFLPSAKRLAAQYRDRAPLSLVLGGLHCGTQTPLEPEMKERIRSHWDQVEKASGQGFDHAFFDRTGFVYDTEPPCRAVAAARRICPESALLVLERLQEAFYKENRDITDEATLVALCAEHLGVKRARFSEVFEQEETLLETYGDFELARELGVRRFPTLLARKACSFTVVAEGFLSLSEIEAPLAAWFDTEPVSEG